MNKLVKNGMAWAAARPFSASALAPRAFCTSDSVHLDAGDGEHECREAALREALAEAERVAAHCRAQLDALTALQGRV